MHKIIQNLCHPQTGWLGLLYALTTCLSLPASDLSAECHATLPSLAGVVLKTLPKLQPEQLSTQAEKHFCRPPTPTRHAVRGAFLPSPAHAAVVLCQFKACALLECE